MRLGVVSDTHDDLDAVERAVDTFTAEDVEAVVHCGDFVAPFSATPFDADFEFYAVRGNNDGEWNLQAVVGEFGEYLGEMGELHLGARDVAVYHGTSEPIVDALCACGTYDYVLRGHTHEAVHEVREGTVHLNPGGIAIPPAPAPFSVATVDLPADEVEFHEP